MVAGLPFDVYTISTTTIEEKIVSKTTPFFFFFLSPYLPTSDRSNGEEDRTEEA